MDFRSALREGVLATGKTIKYISDKAACSRQNFYNIIGGHTNATHDVAQRFTIATIDTINSMIAQKQAEIKALRTAGTNLRGAYLEEYRKSCK